MAEHLRQSPEKTADRLEYLRKVLDDYQEQLEGNEKALVLVDLSDKVRIQQRIRAIRSEMRPYEVEYRQLIAGTQMTDKGSVDATVQSVIGMAIAEKRREGVTPECMSFKPELQSSNENIFHRPTQELKANYHQLRTFLETEAWKEADVETSRVILQVAKRQKEGWLRARDIDNFSCSDLRMIDQLWRDASCAQFGFSLQRKIWLDVNGQPGKFDPETFRDFGDCVGWRVNDNWIRYYNDFCFSSGAPKGHFPSLRFPRAEDGMNWFETWQDSFKGFLTLVDSCFSCL